MNTYKYFWITGFQYHGKVKRPIYWKCFGINWSIRLLLILLIGIAYLKNFEAVFIITIILLSLFCVISLIPSISMGLRRYHDAQLPTYLYTLVYILPIILKPLTRYFPSKPYPLSLYCVGTFCEFIIFICLVLIILLPLFPSYSRKD